MFLFAGTIQQYVVPVGRVEVLDRFQLESLAVDCGLQLRQFLQRPQPAAVGGNTPAPFSVRRRKVGRLAEVINQVRNDMRRSNLLGESEVLAGEHVAVEPKTDFHLNPSVSPGPVSSAECGVEFFAIQRSKSLKSVRQTGYATSPHARIPSARTKCA